MYLPAAELKRVEIAQFISEYKHTDIRKVALKLSKRPELPRELIIKQINGLQKSREKLPFLKFIFPHPLSLSQASSQTTAEYKASLYSGRKLIDLSGGTGIDSYFFSKKFLEVVYVEPRPELAELAKYNFDLTNIQVQEATAGKFLEQYRTSSAKVQEKSEVIYIDPDRRDKGKSLINLQDCQPDIPKLLPLLWQHTEHILLKLSPMLDLSVIRHQLSAIAAIHIIAVANDCKELLVELRAGFAGKMKIITINFSNDKEQQYTFSADEKKEEIAYSPPLSYLYEPNVAIHKANCYAELAADFDLKKLAPNTHLFTSRKLMMSFPGRVLTIEKVDKPQKKWLPQANIISKNFQMKPAEIARKYQIKNGGEQFLYACQLLHKKKVFIHASPVLLT